MVSRCAASHNREPPNTDPPMPSTSESDRTTDSRFASGVTLFEAILRSAAQCIAQTDVYSHEASLFVDWTYSPLK